MDKKGFTTIELILTMALVIVIMVTITNVTYVYRDRSNYEELLTEVTDYKNTVTKIIYDDIVNKSDRVVALRKIDDNNYRLVTASSREYPLVINNQTYQAGVTYDTVNYLIPGSDDGLVTIEDVNVNIDDVNKLYSLEIVFKHRNLDEPFRIKFAITEWKTTTLIDNMRNNIARSTCNPTVTEDGVTYFSGTNDCVNFNYVWYSGKLWRITALYPDGSLKIVTQDNITSIEWGSTEAIFRDSFIYQWLNEDFRDTLYNYSNVTLTNADWNATITNNSTAKLPMTTIETAPVGLLNTHDYYLAYANSSTTNNFLNNGYRWWLLNPNNDKRIYFVNESGSYALGGLYTGGYNAIGVRPSIVIKSNLTISGGDGSKNNPYTVSGDIAEPTYNVTKLNTRNSGEYVNVNGFKFRIVGVENNTTKLIKLDYVSAIDIYHKYFSTNGEFGSGTTTDYWDYYLNTTWYNYFNAASKAMMVKGTYYLGYFDGDDNMFNYKGTVCEERNTSQLIKTCPKVSTTWNGYIGLPRYGEMFATQVDVNTPNDFWLLSPEYRGTVVYYIDTKSGVYWASPTTGLYAARPTMTLSPNTVIISGSGTSASPFEVKLG